LFLLRNLNCNRRCQSIWPFQFNFRPHSRWMLEVWLMLRLGIPSFNPLHLNMLFLDTFNIEVIATVKLLFEFAKSVLKFHALHNHSFALCGLLSSDRPHSFNCLDFGLMLGNQALVSLTGIDNIDTLGLELNLLDLFFHLAMDLGFPLCLSLDLSLSDLQLNSWFLLYNSSINLGLREVLHLGSS
jgi:hypothetical protein